MKNKIFFILISFILLSNIQPHAQIQRWNVGGNNLTEDSRIGSNNAFDFIFETNNQERGRITPSGNWGIGTAAPDARLHINSLSGQRGLRIDINGTPKFNVAGNGGVSIGGSFVATPPVDGLFVTGKTGIGTSLPAATLHVFNGDDVNPGSGGFIIAGNTNSGNIAIDDNEIMARNNGVASGLTLNNNGGNVVVNGTNAADSRIGINTPSPAVDLHLVHSVGSGSNAGLRLRNEGSNGEDWTLYTQNSNGFLQLYANNVLRGQFDDATGAYSAVSDARMKKNIEKAPDLLDKVLRLEVRKYHMLESGTGDKKYYGLMAQEVEKIFPEAVSHNMQDDGKDVYTLDYSVFGVLAIKALQEQHQKINGLEEKITKLEAAIGNCSLMNGTGSNDNMMEKATGVFLEQNQPNPFNQTTTIRYNVPQGAKAQINIYDAAGIVVKTLQAAKSGQVQVNAFNLKMGIYTYALIINGEIAASKKMVITR